VAILLDEDDELMNNCGLRTVETGIWLELLDGSAENQDDGTPDDECGYGCHDWILLLAAFCALAYIGMAAAVWRWLFDTPNFYRRPKRRPEEERARLLVCIIGHYNWTETNCRCDQPLFDHVTLVFCYCLCDNQALTHKFPMTSLPNHSPLKCHESSNKITTESGTRLHGVENLM
jgi:hypothetical protein